MRLTESELDDVLEENAALRRRIQDLNIYSMDLERQLRVIADGCQNCKIGAKVYDINSLRKKDDE